MTARTWTITDKDWELFRGLLAYDSLMHSFAALSDAKLLTKRQRRIYRAAKRVRAERLIAHRRGSIMSAAAAQARARTQVKA